MRLYIAVATLLLILVLQNLLEIFSSHQGGVFFQQPTTVTGYISKPVKPNTPLGGGEPYIASRVSKDISTPVIGLIIGLSLIASGVLYRYAYKRLHGRKIREELHDRLGEG
ncbi:MAG: hypothetical protein QXE01_05995 [Sulfolobales archaeon]